jgi:predicted metal-dependent peptidase
LNQDYWNLAADIAVENILTEMNSAQISCNGVQYQQQILTFMRKDVKPLTAEKIYKYLLEKNYGEEEIEKLKEYFYRDNHGLWWPEDDEKPEADNGDNGAEQPIDLESLMKEWEEISKKLGVDLDTLSKESDKSESLTQGLEDLNRDRYDYKEFLRKFSVRGEDMLINDEEFDYVYYTYGLSHYGNMPLVEPLEYKDTQKICDFVIAIDTSGSVKGAMVQRFLDKTYSILMQQESFFKKINLRIIQCDDALQEEVTITCKEDFDGYMKTMRIKGFGGTDFRPVFNRVEELVKGKEFKNLKGVIYFTDGYGTYPERKPSFDSAFIYLGYNPERPPTPVWAIKLIMDENELAEDIK